METATEALDNIGRMADDMEQRYETKIEILQVQLSDAYMMAESYAEDNDKLNDSIRELRDWNKVHYALYFFLFVYGMVYGAYFRTKEQEL